MSAEHNTNRMKRLVGLVRKLLELSRNNSNAHESGLALRRAQQLMAKYGINELDAELSSIREAETHFAPSEAEKVPAWMERLVWVANHAFGCRAYYSWKEKEGNYRRIVVFYGFNERPAIAAYSFEVLSRQLMTAASSYLKTQNKRLKLSTRRARAEQFRAGWVDGVHRVIGVYSIPENENRLMMHWLNGKGFEKAIIRDARECRGADIARMRGYEAGQNARLHQGVQGRDEELIAIGNNDRGLYD
ncbi:TPA: DUF2786 domain-containing protein [Salmonella enterica]|uniref:DUF7168 domain-containing protein n=1 Tax=Salmonella enterica TaxID=28901 RepID=UPI0009B18651|nr:DUF2786 domain-containing protein [Salmonella enterica]HBD1844130.1 DUF2786 domain-containing protein [Salmonella enterica]